MKKTLVFGASLNPNRYSYLAINKLLGKQIETVAFGPKTGEVSGVQIRPSLDDLENIHSITLYLNKKRQREYYERIVQMKPKRVIFNPGTENPEFYEILSNNGIEVEVACTLVLLATDQY
ncbi:CoA-binding protein [uncultured Eudoraea sp.]|uniref:CoA-binding protein n=1 Tax=uncultured Eudoraea sp. TaxID=1035614 RepID=UPI002622FED7|nr:CoA-binding protein [uncultured Eudoraea sp.]